MTKEDCEIRSQNLHVFITEVAGFDDCGDIVLQNHNKKGESDTMTLSEFNFKVREKASRMRRLKQPAVTNTRDTGTTKLHNPTR